MNASLRSRLLLGAILWTAGLFAAAAIVSTMVMLRYPRYPLILHHTAYTYATIGSIGAILCMIAGFVLVRSGVSPVNKLRTRLAGVREGRERRVEGRYPMEVQPLVDDLNALLEHRERAVARAIAKAGDLAHGLKTPLAVLGQEADRAAAAGYHDAAETIGQQVERMRRQIEYHLAHARAAAAGAGPGPQCAVLKSAEGLSRTLQRLHAARGLSIRVDAAPGHAVRAQREDLDEMLGNLLDNACKWARSRVAVSTTESNGTLVIDVDDDGPGLDASKRDAVLQRGVRADEAAPGSGLGLAIVRDLAELYGGSVALDSSPMGGVRARLQLPRVAAQEQAVTS
jgi:signal transduction histidine kinase